MKRKWRQDMKTVSPGKLVWRQHCFFFFSNITCAALTLYVHTNCWSVPIVCIGMASHRPMVMYRRHRRCIKLCYVEDLLFCQCYVDRWNKSPFSPNLPPEPKLFEVLFASTSSFRMHGKYYSTCSAREVPTRILPSHVLPFTGNTLFRKANGGHQVHTLFHLSDELSNRATIHELPCPPADLYRIHTSVLAKSKYLSDLVRSQSRFQILCFMISQGQA